MRLEIEAAGDQRVEARVQRFARGSGQVGAAPRTEFRADKDCGAFFALAFHEPTFGCDPCSGPAGDGREGNAVGFLRLLDTRSLEVFQNHVGEVVEFVGALWELAFARALRGS